MRTYGNLALSGGEFIISDLEPHASLRLKSLFPRLPKGSRGPFVMPADPAIANDLHWFAQRYPFAGEGETLAQLGALVSHWERVQAEAERIAQPTYQAPLLAGWAEGQGPRPHQAATAELLGLFNGLLCADDTGEGKTFTIMAACMLPGALPATIVCDRHLQLQFAKKFAHYTTLSTHCVRVTEPYVLPPVDVRIISWTQLAGWTDVLGNMGHGLVAADEMQELRHGEESDRGKAARSLFDAALYRLGCTATPSYGYGGEWFNVLSYLRPELLGTIEEFRREWCRTADNGKHIVEDPRALGAYLRDQHAMVRKRKARDRVNRIVRVVQHDTAGIKAIEGLAVQLARTAAHGTFSERGEATRKLDMLVRQATGIAKAPAVAAIARTIVAMGEAVILSGHHRAVYDIWLRELSDLKPAMYTGSETAKEKAVEVERFLSGDTDLIILANRSGRGLDGLQARCRFVIIGELDWSGQVHHQVIGRADRDGSLIDDDPKGTVDALFLVSEDGSDPAMQELVGLKSSQSAGILDPDVPASIKRADEAGLKRLVELYLAKGEAGGLQDMADGVGGPQVDPDAGGGERGEVSG